MLDNTVVRYDKQSYDDMDKDDKEDMKQCKVAWERRLQLERRKQAIETQADGGHSKRRKECNFLTHLNCSYGEEAVNVMLMAVQLAHNVVQQTTIEFYHCRKNPCAWLAQKETMHMFDENEHAQLPDEDRPPNNIRCKKCTTKCSYTSTRVQLGLVLQSGFRNALRMGLE
jgi:hypothetical protein